MYTVQDLVFGVQVKENKKLTNYVHCTGSGVWCTVQGEYLRCGGY